MGTQGEIYVVYGVEVPATVIWEKAPEENPVIYKVGDRAFCDDEDFINGDEAVLDKIAFEGLHYAGIQSKGYGALDPSKQELSVFIKGHSGEFSGNMGARHFCDGFGASVGKTGKALVGYAVSNASYMNSSEPVASLDKIEAVSQKLVTDINEKLGLEIKVSELGLHLVFDWLQGS